MSSDSSSPKVALVKDPSILVEQHLLTREELFNQLKALLPEVIHDASRQQLYSLLSDTPLVDVLYKLIYGHRFGMSALDTLPWIIDDSLGEFGHWIQQCALAHMCGFQLEIKQGSSFLESTVFGGSRLRIIPGEYVPESSREKETYLGLALSSKAGDGAQNSGVDTSCGFILPEHQAWARYVIEDHCRLRVLEMGTAYSWDSEKWQLVLCHALRHILIRSLIGLEFGLVSKALEEGLSIVVPNWKTTLGCTSIPEAEELFFNDFADRSSETATELTIAVDYGNAPLVGWISESEQWHETLTALLRMLTRYCDRDFLLDYNPDGVVVHQPVPYFASEFQQAIQELKRTAEPLGTFDQDLPTTVGSAYHEVLDQIMNLPEVRHAQSLMPEHLCIISRGIGNGASNTWWEIPNASTPGWHAEVVHLGTQNRHPSVRLSLFDADLKIQKCIFIGIKGGGLGTATECDRELWTSTLPEEHRAPIYVRVNENPGPDELGADSYPWGGLYERYGKKELKHHVVLESFLRERDPDLTNHIPKPIKLARLLSLPTWDGQGGTHWLGVQSYALMLMCSLGGLPDPLAALVTVTPSDVRLVAVVNRIFESTIEGRSNVQIRAQEILSTLRFLYWNHGLNLEYQAPEFPLEGCEAPAIGKLLRAICAENRASSQAIYARLIEGPFKIMRLVHLEGGHLGGGYVESDLGLEAGAPNGGALALRNLDILGGLHDLDWCMYLPFQQPALPEETIVVEEVFVKEVQRLEVAYWVETAYWARVILFGELGNPIESAVRTEVSRQNDFTYFCDEGWLSATMQHFMTCLQSGASYEELLGVAQKFLLRTQPAAS